MMNVLQECVTVSMFCSNLQMYGVAISPTDMLFIYLLISNPWNRDVWNVCILLWTLVRCLGLICGYTSPADMQFFLNLYNMNSKSI